MAWRRKINDSWRMSLITPHNAAVRIIGENTTSPAFSSAAVARHAARWRVSRTAGSAWEYGEAR